MKNQNISSPVNEKSNVIIKFIQQNFPVNVALLKLHQDSIQRLSDEKLLLSPLMSRMTNQDWEENKNTEGLRRNRDSRLRWKSTAKKAGANNKNPPKTTFVSDHDPDEDLDKFNSNNKIQDSIKHGFKIRPNINQISLWDDSNGYEHEPYMSKSSLYDTQQNTKPINISCSQHIGKSIEAFCENCKQVLCIQCILDKDHKNHEMVSLEAGSERQKTLCLKNIQLMETQQSDLENQIFLIKSNMQSLEDNAHEQRVKITKIMDEVKKKLISHEQTLQKQISDTLEKEQNSLKGKIKEIEIKLRQVKNLTGMKSTLQIESNIDILLKAKFRSQLIEQAQGNVENFNFKSQILDVRKDDQLSEIVKILVPKKLRPQILSTQLQTQYRLNSNPSFQPCLRHDSIGSRRNPSMKSDQRHDGQFTAVKTARSQEPDKFYGLIKSRTMKSIQSQVYAGKRSYVASEGADKDTKIDKQIITKVYQPNLTYKSSFKKVGPQSFIQKKQRKQLSKGRNFFLISNDNNTKRVRNTFKGVSSQLDLRLEIKEESSLENFRSVTNNRHSRQKSREVPKTSTNFEFAIHRKTRLDVNEKTSALSKNKKMIAKYQKSHKKKSSDFKQKTRNVDELSSPIEPKKYDSRLESGIQIQSSGFQPYLNGSLSFVNDITNTQQFHKVQDETIDKIEKIENSQENQGNDVSKIHHMLYNKYDDSLIQHLNSMDERVQKDQKSYSDLRKRKDSKHNFVYSKLSNSSQVSKSAQRSKASKTQPKVHQVDPNKDLNQSLNSSKQNLKVFLNNITTSSENKTFENKSGVLKSFTEIEDKHVPRPLSTNLGFSKRTIATTKIDLIGTADSIFDQQDSSQRKARNPSQISNSKEKRKAWSPMPTQIHTQVELNSTKNDKNKRKVVKNSLFVQQILNKDIKSELKLKNLKYSVPESSKKEIHMKIDDGQVLQIIGKSESQSDLYFKRESEEIKERNQHQPEPDTPEIIGPNNKRECTSNRKQWNQKKGQTEIKSRPSSETNIMRKINSTKDHLSFDPQQSSQENVESTIIFSTSKDNLEIRDQVDQDMHLRKSEQSPQQMKEQMGYQKYLDNISSSNNSNIEMCQRQKPTKSMKWEPTFIVQQKLPSTKYPQKNKKSVKKPEHFLTSVLKADFKSENSSTFFKSPKSSQKKLKKNPSTFSENFEAQSQNDFHHLKSTQMKQFKEEKSEKYQGLLPPDAQSYGIGIDQDSYKSFQSQKDQLDNDNDLEDLSQSMELDNQISCEEFQNMYRSENIHQLEESGCSQNHIQNFQKSFQNKKVRMSENYFTQQNDDGTNIKKDAFVKQKRVLSPQVMEYDSMKLMKDQVSSQNLNQNGSRGNRSSLSKSKQIFQNYTYSQIGLSKKSSKYSCDLQEKTFEQQIEKENVIEINNSQYSGVNKVNESPPSKLSVKNNAAFDVHNELQELTPTRPHLSGHIGALIKDSTLSQATNNPNSFSSISQHIQKPIDLQTDKSYCVNLQKVIPYRKDTDIDSNEDENPSIQQVKSPIIEFNHSSKNFGSLQNACKDQSFQNESNILNNLNQTEQQSYLGGQNDSRQSLNQFNINQQQQQNNDSFLSSVNQSNFTSNSIFKVKEEFIFIFGGLSHSKDANIGKESTNSSIEVFDVQREICRQFQGGLQQQAQYQDIPQRGFQAVQFQNSQANGFNMKGLKKNALGDKIFILGGVDRNSQLPSDKVLEFNASDMQISNADWSLPQNLSSFAVSPCQHGNYIILAGGETKSNNTLQQISKKVIKLSIDPNSLKNDKSSSKSLNFKIVEEHLSDMLQRRKDFTLLNVNQKQELYSIGGIECVTKNQEVLRSSFIEKYACGKNEWSQVNIQTDQGHDYGHLWNLKGHSSVLLPDCSILIIGGQSKGTNLSSLYLFDTKTSQMSVLPSMNQSRSYFSAVISQNLRYVYCIGGISDDGKVLQSIEKYDICQQKWQILAPMAQSRAMHSACRILI